jgi:transposase-like protein
MSVLSKPYFHDEEAAFAHLESVIWSDGKVCTHCGGLDRITKVKANPAKRIREGLWRCGDCKKQFTVKIGTVFEHMRLPLHKALQAVYLMTSSKKGISAHQLHRILEITYKSAWFLAHRIREAMRDDVSGPLGGLGMTVEADETYIGREPGKDVGPAFHHKMKVVSLVERGTGRARSFVVDGVNMSELEPILHANIYQESRLMTDEHPVYRYLGRAFYSHDTVTHSAGEYVRGKSHTNTIEGFFSIFKRGMKGVYQFCGKQHLHRYLAEFDFRYSNRAALGFNDTDRSVEAMKGIVGKRLTYARPDSAVQ